MTLKYSKQRQAVWDFIKDRQDHPSAESVYVHLRKVLPSISLGTVYRNLLVLKDAGKLVTVDVGDGILHFDPNITGHDHLVCDSCGSISDVDRLGGETFMEQVNSACCCRVSDYSILYHGTCAVCLLRGAGGEDTKCSQ